MADNSYKPDHRGTGDLMRSPQMHGLVELVAHEALPIARGISPDAPPYGEGYVEKFEVSGGEEKIAGTRRAVAYLANVSDHAVIVEVGIPGRQKGHHVLARTADMISGII